MRKVTWKCQTCGMVTDQSYLAVGPHYAPTIQTQLCPNPRWVTCVETDVEEKTAERLPRGVYF